MKSRNQVDDEKRIDRAAKPYTMYGNLVTPVAPRLRTVMKYVDTIQVTTSAGPGTVDTAYNLNSLFAPKVSGGHQPMGFDQIATLYNRYRVLRTRWKVEVIPTVQSGVPGYLVVAPTNTATLFTSAPACAEQGRAKSHIFNSFTIPRLKGAVNLADLNGKTPAAYMADDTTQAVITASPGEALVLHCLIFEPAGSALTYDFHITLWFECEWSDPVQLGQSS